jgi:hypothetical protein
MPKNSAKVEPILHMVDGLSKKHVLKQMPAQYVSDFANAAVTVYNARKIKDILQHKFHIPNDSNYTEDAYLQSASELSVANYVKRKPVSEFDTEKRVNPKTKKNVDVFYRVGSTRVSLEVKCPFEEEQAPFPGNITVLPAGHLPGARQAIQDFRSNLSAGSSMNILEGKNRELRLKDALLSAHQKFLPEPELNDLNILFLACGDYYRMSEWHGNLLGPGGLLTNESFHPPRTYCNVDCVVLSNLKYRHKVAFNYAAWSLDDVLLIPIRNPLGRKNIFDRTVHEGLSIFSHYQKEFCAGRIVTSGLEVVQDVIDPITKVTRFVMVKFQQRYQMRHRKSRDEDALWGFNSAISSF